MAGPALLDGGVPADAKVHSIQARRRGEVALSCGHPLTSMTSSSRSLPVVPRLFAAWVHFVSSATLRGDLLAGLLGAVLVLPQGIAFATLAGLPPQYGLYTAIVPCVVAALFGSSWHVVSGPTNANSLALFAMLSPLALVGSAQYVELALVI